jgi:adenylate cyclase
MASTQRTNVDKSQRIILPMIVGAALLVTLLHTFPVTRHLADRSDRVLLDKYHELGRTTPPRDDIVVLGIDDASLLLDDAWPEDFAASPALGFMKKSYPYPRRVWAMLLDRLFASGAKAVFFDLMFQDASDPEDDRLLREALERHRGKVIIGAKFETSQVGNGELHSSITLPTPEVTGHTTPEPGTFGFLTYWSDPDQVIRKAWFRRTRSDAEKAINSQAIADVDEKPTPSVTMALANIVNPALAAKTSNGERLRFCGTEAFNPRSLHEVFLPPLWISNMGEGAFFKDKIVMVGSVLTVQHDIKRIPPGEIFGVQLHAHALNALLQQSFVQELSPTATWSCFALMVLLAWALVSWVRQPLLCLLSLLGISALLFWISILLFNFKGIEASPLLFMVGLNVCGLSGITGRFMMQLREARRLRRLLARYTSPELVEEMMSDREGLYTMLGGVGRRVTILFSDVRGFTSMSETMTPAEVVKQLNEYLSRMVEQVIIQRGLVDKFIGDAVMALWGGTRSKQDDDGFKQDAINAVTSALAMRSALDELNQNWLSRGMNELKFGIGIHQGDVVFGNIGSEAPHEKMDLTVIGDSVNLASRLEGTTKEYSVDLIISREVHDHVKDLFLCRMADLVAVKGKTLPVEVFAVLGPKTDPAPSGLAEFEQAVETYRKGDFEEALELLRMASAAGLNDALTMTYIERCEHLIEAPPETWDGVFKMTKK